MKGKDGKMECIDKKAEAKSGEQTEQAGHKHAH
jgi:hypothetical protein